MTHLVGACINSVTVSSAIANVTNKNYVSGNLLFVNCYLYLYYFVPVD